MLERRLDIAKAILQILQFLSLDKLIEADCLKVHNVPDVETIDPIVFSTIMDSKVRPWRYFELFLSQQAI